MKPKKRSLIGSVLHGLGVLGGGFVLSLVLFLVLPMLQAISKTPEADSTLRSVATADVPPPPPPPEEEPEEEEQKQEEPKPPELSEEAPPLDLAQLELALNPGYGDGGLAGDFAVKLNAVGAAGSSAEDVDALFSLADLDQQPRVVYQPGPVINAAMRKKAPGTVYILFIVDQQGRVENPIVQKATDPVFEKAALAAVKQWKFEPGKRKGQAVKFRMRVPVTFPAS